MNLERRIEALEQASVSNRTLIVWDGNAEALADFMKHRSENSGQKLEIDAAAIAASLAQTIN
jgi:hypothetical protein